ncbi:MAG TPA: class I SAM-dependent methyltransferase [Terriglobia bacterium]|nr:class I SAM-dependent methyltransferase [Terriglobia bacterium]
MSHAVAVKGYKGFGMEGFTAKWYASLTSKAMDDFRALARRVAGQIRPGARVLEVAPGPGYFAIELAKLGAYQITGLDISQTFVEIARRYAADAGGDIAARLDFRQGNAAAMPFGDESFDFLLCRAAFKNFSQPVQALQEMHRVLKPGGRALVIDLRRDASRDSVRTAVENMGLGPVNTLVTKLTFRFMLLKRAYTRKEFEQFLSHTRFGPGEIREDLTGLDLMLQR